MLAMTQRKWNLHKLIVGIKMVQPLWKTVWHVPKQLSIESSYDPSISLLGIIYLKGIKTCPKICTWIFQFSSVTQSCPTLCDPMNHSTPGLPVHHQLPEFTQTRVHWVSDALQPFHPLLSPSSSQHQDLLKWISSSHQMAKVLEFQLQHQSYQWTPRTDLL